jgi:hypothetical protein
MPMPLHTASIRSPVGRSIAATLAIATAGVMITTRAVAAQERCDDATVRRLSPMAVPDVSSADVYFNVQAGKPPVVGTAQMAALATKHGGDRRNEKDHVYTIQQLVVSADASMAYDDGSVRVEYDEADTGKHVIYDVSYLRVWKVVAGKCRMAATYGRRGDMDARAAVP